MAYQLAAMAVTMNDLEGHSPVAGLFKCNPSNICAAFYTISTDSVLARFLCINRASCLRTRIAWSTVSKALLKSISTSVCLGLKGNLVHDKITGESMEENGDWNPHLSPPGPLLYMYL